MAKFKKGDKVRSLVNDCDEVKVGDIGIVDENNSNYPYVFWEGNTDSWAISEDDMELYNSEPQYEIY